MGRAVIDDLCGNFCYSDYLFIHSHFIAVSGQSAWDGITVDVPDIGFIIAKSLFGADIEFSVFEKA